MSTTNFLENISRNKKSASIVAVSIFAGATYCLYKQYNHMRVNADKEQEVNEKSNKNEKDMELLSRALLSVSIPAITTSSSSTCDDEEHEAEPE